MQVVFDYSWRLLSDQEKAALRKLSVFRGGFERHAAAQVAGADLIILSALIDQAFIERVGNDRYQIHELLRQYLHNNLKEAGEEQITSDQHLQYYVRLVKQAEPELFGKNQRAWLEKLQSEISNLRAALDWCLASQEHTNLETGLRMMTSAEQFWLLHTNTKEGLFYIVQMLAHQPDLQSRTSHVYAYAQGLNLAAKISFFLEDLRATRQFAEKALQIGLELNDARIIADSYYLQGVEANHRGESVTARPLLERSIEYFRQCDYLPGLTQAINVLGRADLFNRDFSASFSNLSTALDFARKLEDMRTIYGILRSLGQLGIAYPQIGLSQTRYYFEESLQYAREQEDKFYIGVILHEMGELARLEGEHEKAAALFEEADAIAKDLGQMEGRIMTQLNLGFAYARLGQYDRSKRIFINNLAATQVEEHFNVELSLCLLGLAGLGVAEGQAKLAAKILGAIDGHKSLIMFWPPDKNEYERILSLAKTQLSEQQFNQLMKEGQTLSLGDAAQLIQNQIVKEKLPNDERLNQLTKREIEVLRLVAQGLSDTQVAERLVLSPRTINAHLTSVYRKLDINSRAAATRFAIEHGLA